MHVEEALKNRSTQRIALVGLLVNFILAAIKLGAGVAGRSHALVADAVESLTDIFGSVVVWSGLRIAAQPPDDKHPYGHGKAEAIASLIVSLTLAAAGLSIALSSVREIMEPRRAPATFTLWVLLGVVAVKEILFRIGRGISKTSGSGAVLADAWHHRSDAITSAAAAIGISAALLGGPGWERADGAAALFASAIILYNAWRLIHPPLRELMDANPSAIVNRVRAIARNVPNVEGIEKVMARKSGRKYLVDLHMEVDPRMSVRDAHALAHRVKDVLRREMPQVQDVLIHVEPFQGRGE
jgi:cation diffusion facilitator family transporter